MDLGKKLKKNNSISLRFFLWQFDTALKSSRAFISDSDLKLSSCLISQDKKVATAVLLLSKNFITLHP